MDEFGIFSFENPEETNFVSYLKDFAPLKLLASMLGGIYDMENNVKAHPGCSFLFTIFSLATVAFPLYLIWSFFNGIWQFLLKPDVIARSLEILRVFLLFFVAGSLFIWLILISATSRGPWEGEDDLYDGTSKWFEKLWMSPIILLGICLFALIPLFIPMIAFYVDIIAPHLKGGVSQHKMDRDIRK